MSSSYNECRRVYHMPQQAEMGTMAIGSKLSVPFTPHTIFDLNHIGGFLGISFSICFLTSQVPMGFESLLSLIIMHISFSMACDEYFTIQCGPLNLPSSLNCGVIVRLLPWKCQASSTHRGCWWLAVTF